MESLVQLREDLVIKEENWLLVSERWKERNAAYYEKWQQRIEILHTFLQEADIFVIMIETRLSLRLAKVSDCYEYFTTWNVYLTV